MPVKHAEKCFIDTNVVLYLYSEDEPDKKAAAEAVVRGAERAWISTQVLSEMANVLRRKFRLDLPGYCRRRCRSARRLRRSCRHRRNRGARAQVGRALSPFLLRQPDPGRRAGMRLRHAGERRHAERLGRRIHPDDQESLRVRFSGHGSVTMARIESVFSGHLSSAPILDL